MSKKPQPELPPVKLIDPRSVFRPDDNPNRMSVEEYASLRAFIKSEGFLQPVLVRLDPTGEHEFIIVDGDHRTRIALELDMPLYPAMVVEKDQAHAIATRLGMNKHRGQLDLSDVARDLEFLVSDADFGAEEIELTGFTNEDAMELLETIRPTTSDDILEDGVSTPPPDEVEPDIKSWNMTLKFDSESDRARVKAVLLAAADGGSLATGLLELV